MRSAEHAEIDPEAAELVTRARRGGAPLDEALRPQLEAALGAGLDGVRVHTGTDADAAARALGARAFAIGDDMFFRDGAYDPHGRDGQRLIAHEVAHTVQMRGAAASVDNTTTVSRPGDTPEREADAFADAFVGSVGTRRNAPAVPDLARRSIADRIAGSAHREGEPVLAARISTPRVSRQDHTIDVEVIVSRDSYQLPGSPETYRVGDAAATRVLMDIQERGAVVVFRVYNFETGAAEEMSPAGWSFFTGAAIIGGSNAAITRLGRLLSPAQWRALWPNPLPEVLRLFEAGQLNLDDDAVLSGYHGMIRSDASRSLDDNEHTIDSILGASDRVLQIQEFATGLREASLVRDALTQRRDELSRRLVAQHSFTFGLPHAGTGPDIAERLEIERTRGEIEDTLGFWLSAFPLLTRLQTGQIGAASVEARLREIKANIVSTREELDRGRLDPMTLDPVRARLTGRLGPRTTAVVAAEDRSRARWVIAGAVASTAATIGILFLPGGVFIDAAIGVAIAGNAIADAAELGRAANTGLHIDDGLVSQAQAEGARFAAVLTTVFAVVGAAAAGFRVLRVGLAMRGLGRAMPDLAVAERTALARAIADDAGLLSTFTRVAPDDAAVSARVAAAVRQAGGDARALREALRDIAQIAAIPRRVPTTPDLYEPLRRITDGSDIERVATQTGLSRAEVEAAKRNLMLDEHILVDNTTGAVYRARFDPFEEIASVWGRAARGEVVSEADRDFLRRLVRHEHAEGALLSASGRTLEHAFLRGELEGQLQTFLRSLGWNQTRIARMLAAEPRPITPYRYAHLVSALSGAPNP